jgi:hypothetical protein
MGNHDSLNERGFVAHTSLCQARFGFHCFDTNKLPDLPSLAEENSGCMA